LRAEYQASIDKAAGSGKIILPAFDPRKLITVPEGASHYLLLTGITAVDFDAEVSFQTVSISEPAMLKTMRQHQKSFLWALPEPSGDLPVFVVFGIEIYSGRQRKEVPA
jgi:hypothetical protein